MNCQEFERIILDVARERLLEADLRRAGLTHAGGCTRCAARLAEERALSSGLRSLAQADRRDCHTPQRIEYHLRAALRARKAPARPPQPARSFGWHRWALVAAAVLLALLPLGLWRQATNATPAPHIALVTPETLPLANDWAWAGTPKPTIETTPPPASHKSDGAYPTGELIHKAAYHPPIAARPRTVVKRNAVKGDSREFSHELVTEFFPLDEAGTLPPTDEVQVVRIKLPRSVMASFGLPVNPALTNERVTADVVIGIDGIARAVRFVR